MREKLCPQEPIHFFDIWHIVKHMYLDVGTLIYVGCCNYIFLHSQIFHFVAAQKYVWGQLWMLLQRRGSVWSRGCGGQTLLTTCSGMQLPQSGENNPPHQKKKKKKGQMDCLSSLRQCPAIVFPKGSLRLCTTSGYTFRDYTAGQGVWH